MLILSYPVICKKGWWGEALSSCAMGQFQHWGEANLRQFMVMQIWQTILEWSEDKKRALSMLWGSHLRFFRQLVSRAYGLPCRLPAASVLTWTCFCPVLPHCALQVQHLICMDLLFIQT